MALPGDEDPPLYMQAVWSNPGSQYQTKCYRSTNGSSWTYVTTKAANVTYWSTGYLDYAYYLGIRHYNPTTGAEGSIRNLGNHGTGV